jgi:hypothetical protein
MTTPDMDEAPRTARPTDKPTGKAGDAKPDKKPKPEKAKGGKGGKGKLVLSVGGVETAMPPGHAIAVAVAACGGTAEGLTVDAVRAAAPDAVQVCDTVTLRALVGGDDTEVPEGDPA